MRTQPQRDRLRDLSPETHSGQEDRPGLRNHISTAKTVKLNSDALLMIKTGLSIPQEETGQEKSAIRLHQGCCKPMLDK